MRKSCNRVTVDPPQPWHRGTNHRAAAVWLLIVPRPRTTLALEE
jgi:hypothetical protein